MRQLLALREQPQLPQSHPPQQPQPRLVRRQRALVPLQQVAQVGEVQVAAAAMGVWLVQRLLGWMFRLLWRISGLSWRSRGGC